MAKVRLEITKGDGIRYLSHLDYARAVERALRRSKLPVAYSEGFNPHMKVAYASALGVGVASDAEYMDMELKEDVALEVIRQKLAAQLPHGVTLKALKYVGDRTPALMAVVNQAVYEVTVPLVENGDDAMKSLNRFDETPQILYIKESPKGRREIDVKQFIPLPIAATVNGSALKLDLVIHITKTGTVKAAEVLDVLVSQFGLPVHQASAIITRKALYIVSDSSRLTPMETI